MEPTSSYYRNLAAIIEISKEGGEVIGMLRGERVEIQTPIIDGLSFYDDTEPGYYRAVLRFDDVWVVAFSSKFEPDYEFIEDGDEFGLRTISPYGDIVEYLPEDRWPALPNEHREQEDKHKEFLKKSKGIAYHIREIAGIISEFFDEAAND